MGFQHIWGCRVGGLTDLKLLMACQLTFILVHYIIILIFKASFSDTFAIVCHTLCISMSSVI